MRRTTWLSLAATAAMGAGAVFAAPGPAPGGPGAHDMGGPGMGGPGMGSQGMGMMDGPGMMMGGPNPRMLERMTADLQLSPDQQQKIRGVFDAARPGMEQARANARANAEKLRAAQPGSAGYDAVVAEVARNAGELASRAVTSGAQVRAQVWAVLTPDQRQKLETLQAQRQARMQQRMKERMDRQRGAPPR